MVAKRQASLRVWQIVRIQTRFRTRAARAKLRHMVKCNAVGLMQNWWREVLARTVFAERSSAQKVICRWWVGLGFLYKLEQLRALARASVTVLQASARRLIARVAEKRRVETQRRSTEALHLDAFFTKAYYASARRWKSLVPGGCHDPDCAGSPAETPIISSGVFRPREFQLDTHTVRAVRRTCLLYTSPSPRD